MADPVLVTNPARPRDHGSGFVIRRLDGAGAQVVTCSHVVRALGAEGLQVAGQPARVIVDLVGDGVDLAVLAVPGLTELAPLELQRGTVGEAVELHGFEPAGGGPVAFPHRGRLASQSLTALAGKNRPAWHLELEDGEIEGGHSGGPVISRRTGRVVGVIAMGPDQKGGKDGVAVAIENLRVWKETPPIAPARPRTDDGSSSGAIVPPDSSGLPWRWIVIGGGSLLLAGVIAVLAWRRSPAAPVGAGCAIPDIGDSFERVAIDDWCPATVTGAPACLRRFDDGTVVTGTCVGSRASGTWKAVDAQGQTRWEAHFDERSERRTGTWMLKRSMESGAVVTVTTQFDVAGLAGSTAPRAVRTEEWRCALPGVGERALVFADTGAPTSQVTLQVGAASIECTVHQVGPVPTAAECRGRGLTVTGPAGLQAYYLIRSKRAEIERCEPFTLPDLPRCGDGKQDDGEECDDGAQTEACTDRCTRSRCGDGIVNRADREACDPGGPVDVESCDRDCTAVACGDGILNTAAHEVCEPPPRAGTSRCETNCLAPRCGDRIRNRALGETCDTGGDSKTCDRDCTPVKCGDRLLNAAVEACDPPPAVGTAACEINCLAPRCGDKIVNAALGEECDGGPRCTTACKKSPGPIPTRPIRSTQPTPTAGAGSG
jgi:hypothetical protein